MSDYYTESQVKRIEQDAHDGAMLEAGKEWERQRYEFGATEAKLAERVTELENRIAEAKRILEDAMFDWLPVGVVFLPEDMRPIRYALDALEASEEDGE